MIPSGSRPKWIEHLDDEDIVFVKRFILSSGSLKELARAYGVSYPTVRLRLDRLIERVKVWDSVEITSDFEKQLRVFHAEGKIDLATLNAILDAHRAETEEKP
jgi:hypothetical protein